MRIGVDIRHLTRGGQTGVGQYTLDVLRAMINEAPNDEFLLLSTGTKKSKWAVQKNLGDILSKQNVKHLHQLIPNRVLNAHIILTNRPRLEKLFDIRPDVIWNPNLNFIPESNVPYVITFHDLAFEIFRSTYSKKHQLWHKLAAPKALAKRAAAIIVPSETTKEDLVAIYKLDPNKVHVIPHGVSENYSPRALPQDHGIRSQYNLPKNYILHVGSFDPRKNIHTLVEGYLKAFRESPVLRSKDVHLVLTGNKSQNNYLPRDPHIHLLDYVPNEHLPVLYRQASLVAFPSLYEGFGLPILEGFASGTPVITSSTSSMLEVGGDAVIFVDPYNSKDISRAISSVIGDDSLYNHLIARGLARSEEFSWQKTARKTLQILHSTIS